MGIGVGAEVGGREMVALSLSFRIRFPGATSSFCMLLELFSVVATEASSSSCASRRSLSVSDSSPSYVNTVMACCRCQYFILAVELEIV